MKTGIHTIQEISTRLFKIRFYYSVHERYIIDLITETSDAKA